MIVRHGGIPQQHARRKKAAARAAECGVAGIDRVVVDRAVFGDQVIACIRAAGARIGRAAGFIERNRAERHCQIVARKNGTRASRVRNIAEHAIETNATIVGTLLNDF